MIDFGGDKKYIGSTINFRNRRNSHLSALRTKRSNCIKLQRAFNKYGESLFNFSVIYFCSIKLLSEKELEYIKKYNAIRNGYNIALDTKIPMLGRKHSKLTRLKMSNKSMGNKSNSGRKFTKEHKAKIGLSKIGKKRKPFSKEWIENMSLVQIGEKNHFYGKSHTIETIEKIRATKLKQYKNH